MSRRHTRSTQKSRPADSEPVQLPPAYTGPTAAQRGQLTTILLAAEALAAPVVGTGTLKVQHAQPLDAPEPAGDLQPLLRIAEDIGGLLGSGGVLAEQILGLPESLGSGDALAFLFRSLFPRERPAPMPDCAGHPFLSSRELEVLWQLTSGKPHADIAVLLDIAPRTVDRHVGNIYRKLGVRGPIQAAARARELGYHDPDGLDMSLERSRRHERGVQPLRAFCATALEMRPPIKTGRAAPIAALGLFLLMVSAAMERQVHGDAPREWPRGAICELRPDGRILRVFGQEVIEAARSIAVVPDRAAEHGFKPGNLLVAHDLHPQDGLSRGAITESTPGGEYVRTFTGGSEIGIRLVGPLSLAFHADGRLLATSGWLTNAILAFEDGGTTVRRFIDGWYFQVSVGPDGRIYGAPGDFTPGLIRIWDPDGTPAGAITGPDPGWHYLGLTVNSAGHVYAVARREGDRMVEQFDVNGQFVRSVPLTGLDECRLSVDSEGRLYVPCSRTREIAVLTPAGEVQSRLPLSPGLVPTSAASGNAGRLWVCGYTA